MAIKDSVVIFPGAHIIRSVELDEDVSIWYNAVLRGDRGTIKIGKGSNVQDNCVIHSSDEFPVTLGENVSIGHGAVIHGCTIEDNVLIGMNATVLNGAKISKNSLVGAGAVVTENKEFPENSLILGVPARVVAEIPPEKVEGIINNAKFYVELSKSYEE